MHTHEVPRAGAGEEPFIDSGPGSGPPEALILDIGEDIGALIVYADETCLGQEIDLTPVGAPRSHHIHTMIRRRRAVDRDVIAGVYPELRQGQYTLWGLDGLPLGDVFIRGGHVASFAAASCCAAAAQRSGSLPGSELP